MKLRPVTNHPIRRYKRLQFEIRLPQIDTDEHMQFLFTALLLQYSTHRRRVRRDIQGQLTLGVLLGSKKGTKLAICYLRDTQIATRDWNQREADLDNMDDKEDREEDNAEGREEKDGERREGEHIVTG